MKVYRGDGGVAKRNLVQSTIYHWVTRLKNWETFVAVQ